MIKTPNPNAIDLMKPGNPGESTRQLFNCSHVPSSKTVRTIVCSTSPVLVSQTNYTRIGNDRCTTHLNDSVDHTVVELHMLELNMTCNDAAMSSGNPIG